MAGSLLPVGHLNECGQRWTLEVADCRIHGTTHRRPTEAFLEEKLLRHISKPPYRVQNHLLRKVSNDCLVVVETQPLFGPLPLRGQDGRNPMGPGGDPFDLL